MLISRKSTQEEGRAWAKALRSVNIQEAIVAGAKEPEKLREEEGEGGGLGLRGARDTGPFRSSRALCF